MKKTLTTLVTILFIGIAFVSSINANIGNTTYIGQLNNPPYTPSIPNPSNGSINVTLMSSIRWTGGDPDGNPVIYDVYMLKWSTRIMQVTLVS